MTDETRQVISDYLAGCRTNDPRFDDAAMRITMMTFLSTPELQWEVILEAVRQAADEVDLGHIAAGPIEGLLGRHGPAWIERVEAEARWNAKFARAVTGVWKYMMTDEVWKRVKAVKSFVPLEQWLPEGRQELAKRPDRFAGMTTNERLYAAGLLPQLDDAAARRDPAAMIEILRQVKDSESSDEDLAPCVDEILAHPEKYLRHLPPAS